MLKEKLQADVKEALKAGNSQKRMVLGMVLAAIRNREFDKRAKFSKTEPDVAKLEEMSHLNDEEVVEVLSSEIKKRKDSIDQYEKGGRPELAQGEKSEMDMLMSYMPEQISEDDLRKIVQDTVSETGISDMKEMGKLIGAVMVKVKGKADGSLVGKLVKEALQK